MGASLRHDTLAHSVPAIAARSPTRAKTERARHSHIFLNNAQNRRTHSLIPTRRQAILLRAMTLMSMAPGLAFRDRGT